GALSVSLTAIGIYGLLAFELSRRTREFGIRMALGATRGRVIRLVCYEALGLCTAGVAIGVLAALWTASLVATQLFGVPARDPLTIVGAVACIGAVLAIATLLLTLWGLRLSPMRALRQD